MKPNCRRCGASAAKVIRKGRYFRQDDAQTLPRYFCNACGRSFSHATGSPRCYQKKRRANAEIERLFANGASMASISELTRLSPGLVRRRLISSSAEARARHQARLEALSGVPVTLSQFDEMFTFEHTKLKPIAISVIADAAQYQLLGAIAARSPATGHLAEKSRKKYGHRVDETPACRYQLLESLVGVIDPCACFKTDQHSDYPIVIRTLFPEATHIATKGRPACITGQGEMKKGGFDPLFCINHIQARLRDRIKRLARRTWCTTKRIEYLQMHLDILVDYYNRELRPARFTEVAL